MSETKITLNSQQRSRLRILESQMAKGVTIFAEGLKEIRDTALYKESYATWGDYVLDKFVISKSTADRLIQACELRQEFRQGLAHTSAVDNLADAAIRELAKVPESRRDEVLNAAVETAAEAGARVTTKAVVEARVAAKPSSNGSTRSSAHSSTSVSRPAKSSVKTLPSAAKLVDSLIRKYVSHLPKAIDAIARENGGKGPVHTEVDNAINVILKGLMKMREGQQ